MFFRKNKRKGFTLVEIMVSISILVTILAIVTKLLFDFSKSAYRVSFQMKNTETIRNIFRKIEKQLMPARAVIYKYDIKTARSNTITELRESCRQQVSPYAVIPCIPTAGVNLGKLKSGNDMLIVSLPVFNRDTTGGSSQDPLLLPDAGTVTGSYTDYVAPVPPPDGIAGYPYKSLPSIGEYLSSDPLDVDRVDSPNDVVIIYKDSNKSLRLYQLPSRVVGNSAPFTNQPFSRYKDQTSYQFKGEIKGSKLADNIEDTITTFTPGSDLRKEIPYDLFTYYTPTDILLDEPVGGSASVEIGKLVPESTNGTLTGTDIVTPSEVAQVLAIRVKITKSSEYDVKFSDPIDLTNRPHETTTNPLDRITGKKRIDEKTKESIFRLNRSDTIN